MIEIYLRNGKYFKLKWCRNGDAQGLTKKGLGRMPTRNA